MIFLLPFVAAVLGYFCNQLLIRFYIDKKWASLVSSLKQQLCTLLIRTINIKEASVFLAKEEQLRPLYPTIEYHLDNLLRNRIKEKLPMVAMLLGDKSIDKIKSSIIDEIQEALPNLILQLGENDTIKAKINQVVQEKIEHFQIDTSLVWKHIKRPVHLLSAVSGSVCFVVGVLCLLCYLYFA